VLQDAVSAYAGKSPDEDQADTARQFMTNLADSLVQAAKRPDLPGSQRFLHILEEIAKSTPGAPTIQWWIDVALGRGPAMSTKAIPDAHLNPEPPAAPAGVSAPTPQERLIAMRQIEEIFGKITNENRGFIVRGSSPDETTPNPALQEDVQEFATVADALKKLERLSDGRYSATDDLAELTGLLDAYQAHVARHYSLTPQTGGIFKKTRGIIAQSLPEPIRRNIQERWHNPHLLKKIDDVLFKSHGSRADFPVIKKAIREVQPSVVWLELATGVIISPDGWVLTNAHVTKEQGKEVKVQLANGDTYHGTCTALDEQVDLALVKLKDVKRALPFSKFSPRALSVGSEIITIGNPDTRLYDGWHVSTGKVTEMKEAHPWTSPEGFEIGGIIHNSWTYYGNSGSPIYNTKGAIVALHHWWRAPDRHAIDATSTIIPWLKKHKIPFRLAD
jgi:S1-C subfamily serine protease